MLAWSRKSTRAQDPLPIRCLTIVPSDDDEDTPAASREDLQRARKEAEAQAQAQRKAAEAAAAAAALAAATAEVVEASERPSAPLGGKRKREEEVSPERKDNGKTRRLQRDNTMVETAREGKAVLSKGGDKKRRGSTRPQDKPPMHRDNTMVATAKAAEAILDDEVARGKTRSQDLPRTEEQGEGEDMVEEESIGEDTAGEAATFEDKLLQFLNSADVEAMCGLATIGKKRAQTIVAKRGDGFSDMEAVVTSKALTQKQLAAVISKNSSFTF